MTIPPETRAERRAITLAERRAERDKVRAAAKGSSSSAPQGALGAIVAPPAADGTIDVQSSMAGFTPSEIRVTAGETVTMNWWTDDAAVHLQGGVHTMVAPELGLNEALPAENSRMFIWQVPDRPGTYDVYCETCCGGKDSPPMHGQIVIA